MDESLYGDPPALEGPENDSTNPDPPALEEKSDDEQAISVNEVTFLEEPRYRWVSDTSDEGREH
jgi:hypothetical protein